MDIAIFIAIFAALSFWGTYGSVPFTTIDPSRPVLDRLGGSLQATTVVYALDSADQYYNAPDTINEEATSVAADLPKQTPKTELDHLMEMVKEEYGEKGNVVILFPTKNATPFESTVSPPVTLFPDSLSDMNATATRLNMATYRPSPKTGNGDATILSFIGVLSVIYMVCKSIFGCPETAPERVPQGLEEFEDRLLQRVSEHLDRSIVPLQGLVSRQEESVTVSLVRETAAKFDRLAAEFRELQRDYARSAAPRSDPAPPVNVNVNTNDDEGASTLKTLHSEQVGLRAELKQVHSQLDNLHEESKIGLRSVQVKLEEHFDIKLDKLQKALEEHLENVSSKRLSVIEQDLFIEDRRFLRSGVEALSKRVTSVEKDLEKFLSDQTPTDQKEYVHQSLETLSKEVASIKEGLTVDSSVQSINDLAKDIQGLHTNLEILSEKVNSIEKDLNGVLGDKTSTNLIHLIDANLKTLSERVTSLEGQALSRDQSTADLTNSIGDLRSYLDRLSDNVSTIKKSSEDISNGQLTIDVGLGDLRSSFKTLSERVSLIEKDVAASSGYYDELTANAAKDVENLRANLQTLTERVSAINEKLTAVSGDHDRSTANLTKNLDELRTSFEKQAKDSKEITGQVQKNLDTSLDSFRKELNQQEATIKKKLAELVTATQRSRDMHSAVNQKEWRTLADKVDMVASQTEQAEKKHSSLEKRFEHISDNYSTRLRQLEKLPERVVGLERVEKMYFRNIKRSLKANGLDLEIMPPGDKPEESAIPAKEVSTEVDSPSSSQSSPASPQAPVSLPGLQASRWAVPVSGSPTKPVSRPPGGPASSFSPKTAASPVSPGSRTAGPVPDLPSSKPPPETKTETRGSSSSEPQTRPPEQEPASSQSAEKSASPTTQAADPAPGPSPDAPESSKEQAPSENQNAESKPSPKEPASASHGDTTTTPITTDPSPQASSPANPTPSASRTGDSSPTLSQSTPELQSKESKEKQQSSSEKAAESAPQPSPVRSLMQSRWATDDGDAPAPAPTSPSTFNSPGSRGRGNWSSGGRAGGRGRGRGR
ncbi:hypothetical protein T310_7108 [Rasamsonia emersonii CBS 393.64]|uniref:Uncharacterized protein n=1 Tax=Rasamsonia emersonii (strain ATCC 16479 / CBS 393.64 / IMI 116815) TaxID=1408163 RepID=A0A0F4YL33_RASE3|nr:hypothetical protein T310_7108 [Rasamsonia emersonii CBS 393.64]KKA18939.1 hypothetical protein T310_7108 [Rasamsonia emersonii CBS 393.64]